MIRRAPFWFFIYAVVLFPIFVSLLVFSISYNGSAISIALLSASLAIASMYTLFFLALYVAKEVLSHLVKKETTTETEQGVDVADS